MARRGTLDLLKTDAAPAVILTVASAAALILANSPWSAAYFNYLDDPFTIQIGSFIQTHSHQAWIKDGLMAIFFFAVGLEVKYQALRGELTGPRRLVLPLAAVAGGMALPALIYLAIAPQAHGWPAPTASDLTLALAVLAIVGPRLPAALRAFLLTSCAVGDLAALAAASALSIGQIQWEALGGATSVLALMALLGRWRRAPQMLYGLGFVLLWAFAMAAQIPTALAGAAAAATLPINPTAMGGKGLVEDALARLRPYLIFVILPLFAFTAAGFQIDRAAFGPIAIGVAAALFVGKPLGMFGAASLVIGMKLARRPTGVRWIELYGASLLCGGGLSASLFMGQLLFADGAERTQAQAGVVVGTILSVLTGAAVLGWAQARRDRDGG